MMMITMMIIMTMMMMIMMILMTIRMRIMQSVGRTHPRAAVGRPPFVHSFIEAFMETISLLAE